MKKNYLLISLLSIIFFLTSCEDNPSEAGSSIIPKTDAAQFKTLETDSIPYTYSIFQKSLSTSAMGSIVIGKHGNEEAVGLLKFSGFADTLAGATVISADIVMFPTNYSLGNTSNFGFSVHAITSTWSAGSAGNAMISGPIYDNSVAGKFSGEIPDTGAIYIPISTSLVKNWLVIASDVTKANLNQGVVLLSDPNSSCARSFYSKDNTDYTDNSKDPYLRVIKEYNGIRDTIFVAPEEDSYYAFSRNFDTTSQNIVMQSGISYRTKMTLDVSRVPKHSHISNATITLTLDNSDSYIGNNSIDSIAASGFEYNTNGVLINEYTITGFPSTENGNKVYTLNITLFLQGWINTWQNAGFEIYQLGELLSLDRYSFYSNKCADVSKRPKLKVTYLTLPN
jgi:hypothetical protein